MTDYRVVFKAAAFAYINVEAEDEDAAEMAAYDHVPSICAQCSGWGREGVSLELGDEWETETIEEMEP